MTDSSSDHERIWLEPEPGSDPDYGRMWCQDNVWGDEATEYVRADKVELLEERIGQLEDDLDDARHEPWPEWASSILKTLKHYGYDPVEDDGTVDLAQAFGDYLEGIEQADEQYKSQIAAKDAEIAQLHALVSSRLGIASEVGE